MVSPPRETGTRDLNIMTQVEIEKKGDRDRDREGQRQRQTLSPLGFGFTTPINDNATIKAREW